MAAWLGSRNYLGRAGACWNRAERRGFRRRGRRGVADRRAGRSRKRATPPVLSATGCVSSF